jgi:hypothetical protein
VEHTHTQSELEKPVFGPRIEMDISQIRSTLTFDSIFISFETSILVMETTVTYLSIVSSTKMLAKQSLTTLTAKYKRNVYGSLVRIATSRCQRTLEGSRETTKDLRGDIQCYGRDSNGTPHKCKAGVLTSKHRS